MRLQLDIPEELMRYFAADPSGPLFSVPDLISNTQNPLNRALDRCLRSLSSELVLEVKRDGMFRSLNTAKNEAELDNKAREWALVQALNAEIPRRRIKAIVDPTLRPAPYDLLELQDLHLDEEYLVSLKEFNFNGSVLERDGRAYLMMPSAESPNASYWFLLQAVNHKLENSLRIRLDPFMHGPAETFPNMMYRMWLYGRQLDWDRLATLKEAEYGRWIPSGLTRGVTFTDFVWEPRGDEVHFICEELPENDRIEMRGARYLHAVYLPDSANIVHFDGALRVYAPEEFERRRAIHVRSAGKMGTRVKLFRTDTPISRDCLADLAMTYLVWNDDVARYFDSGGQNN